MPHRDPPALVSAIRHLVLAALAFASAAAAETRNGLPSPAPEPYVAKSPWMQSLWMDEQGTCAAAVVNGQRFVFRFIHATSLRLPPLEPGAGRAITGLWFLDDEVSGDQFAAVTGAGGAAKGQSQGSLTWNDVTGFCTAFNTALHVDARCPTTSEYMCLFSRIPPFSLDARFARLQGVDRADTVDATTPTLPVAPFHGLRDIYGDLWELCADQPDATLVKAIFPDQPDLATHDLHLLAGGAADTNVEVLMEHLVSPLIDGQAAPNAGFRIVIPQMPLTAHVRIEDVPLTMAITMLNSATGRALRVEGDAADARVSFATDAAGLDPCVAVTSLLTQAGIATIVEPATVDTDLLLRVEPRPAPAPRR